MTHNQQVKLVPSILEADFACLGKQVAQAKVLVVGLAVLNSGQTTDEGLAKIRASLD